MIIQTQDGKVIVLYGASNSVGIEDQGDFQGNSPDKEQIDSLAGGDRLNFGPISAAGKTEVAKQL